MLFLGILTTDEKYCRLKFYVQGFYFFAEHLIFIMYFLGK